MPDAAEVAFARAFRHAAEGRLDEAAADYRRALQARPQYFEALANLGKVHEQRGGWEEAAACYRRALALRPQEVPVLAGLGMALAHLGRVDESIAAWSRAVAVMPAYSQGWIALAEMLAKARRTAEAIAAFDRALALEPGNAAAAFARDALAGVQVAQAPASYVRDFFDGFAAEFDHRLGVELEYRGPQLLGEALAPWIGARRDLRVLDLGCGTGLSGAVLRPFARQLAGVDLSGAMLARARERGVYDALVQEDIATYLAACAPAALDLIVALDVFIYVGDLRAVFAAAAAALAPGGALAFSVESLDAGEGYRLLPSGRYAHSRAYISQQAAAAGLRADSECPVVLRKESGSPVPAVIYRLSPAAR